MISDIKIDFEELKSILLDVIQQYKALINADKSIIFRALYSDYEPKSAVDISNIYIYTRKFEEYYKNKIKDAASHCSEDKMNFNIQKVSELEQDGKIFASGVFNVFRKHLFLEMRLENKNYELEIAVITKLTQHIGNIYYYLFEKSKICKLFEYAVTVHTAPCTR